jgi:pimeloyl-ACP methyl ester carboxylesterase
VPGGGYSVAVILPHDDVGAGPAVVLLPAGVADRTVWSEHLEPLAARGHRVVAMDLPGSGVTPDASAPQAPWVDVLETLDALAIERAALVGNSFGGAVALRVAAVAPARVSALVMVSAPAPDLDPSPELRAAWQAEEDALERGDVDAAVAAVVDAWTQPGAPPAVRDRVAAMQRRIYEVQGDAPWPEEAPDPVQRGSEALSARDVPTVVAAGEHDRAEFRAGAERMAAAIPGARHALIAGAGHLAPLEAPEAFRALVLDVIG